MEIFQIFRDLISDNNRTTKIECGLLAVFIADETGATAIEYSLLAALIALACVATVQTVGSKVSGSYQATADALDQ